MRLMRLDLPTLLRPEKATWATPRAASGGAWPIWPMAPANSTDLMRSGALGSNSKRLRLLLAAGLRRQDEQRRHPFRDALGRHHHLAHVGPARDVEHDV